MIGSPSRSSFYLAGVKIKTGPQRQENLSIDEIHVIFYPKLLIRHSHTHIENIRFKLIDDGDHIKIFYCLITIEITMMRLNAESWRSLPEHRSSITCHTRSPRK